VPVHFFKYLDGTSSTAKFGPTESIAAPGPGHITFRVLDLDYLSTQHTQLITAVGASKYVSQINYVYSREWFFRSYNSPSL